MSSSSESTPAQASPIHADGNGTPFPPAPIYITHAPYPLHVGAVYLPQGPTYTPPPARPEGPDGNDAPFPPSRSAPFYIIHTPYPRPHGAYLPHGPAYPLPPPHPVETNESRAGGFWKRAWAATRCFCCLLAGEDDCF